MKILQLNIWNGRVKGSLARFFEQNDFELGETELDFYEDVQIQEDELGSDIFYGEQPQENNDDSEIIIEPQEDIKDVPVNPVEEAENEEEEGIRWKHRTLRKRLLSLKNLKN